MPGARPEPVPPPLPAFADLPEHLPGEPTRRGAEGLALAARVLGGAVGVAIVGALTAPLWPLYLLSVAVYGWPPHVPRAVQFRRYLAATWSGAQPPPGLSLGRRAWLTVLFAWRAAILPARGLAWQLDELLFGRRLDAVPIAAPLFEISAARSGSTQLAHYLEDDPALAAPSVLQCLFPYLWLWHLVRATLGRALSEERVRAIFHAQLWDEFNERHEGDPYRTDTFEVPFYLAHLNGLAFFLGPDVARTAFAAGPLTPDARALWDHEFVDYLERIGRKALVWRGPLPDGRPRRLFVKGHYLPAASALARRFPDARFFTVVRRPDRRLQSSVNYLRANPIDNTLGPIPWPWLAETLLDVETAYCEDELAWFGAPDGPRRHVVRFDAYVRDLPGTLAAIYADCLDGAAPPGLPEEHPPRRRAAYMLDRSLAQVGIDEAALNARLADYVAWCAPPKRKPEG